MNNSHSSKRGRGRPKTFDRERAIEDAMRLLWQRGPGVLSVNELCGAVGIAKPSLYREFGGEDGLVATVLECYLQTRTLPLLDELTQDLPMARLVNGLANWLVTPSTDPAGCLLAKTRSTLDTLGPKTTAQVEKMKQTQRAKLTAWMQRAQNNGELAAGLDPTIAGRFVDTQLTTLLMLAAQGEPADLLKAQTTLAFSGLTNR
ncbi:MAG: TetR/AcrR family transcriptional regulator [Pseudomonadota bacterium]